jgi:hypothetical protein
MIEIAPDSESWITLFPVPKGTTSDGVVHQIRENAVTWSKKALQALEED